MVICTTNFTTTMFFTQPGKNHGDYSDIDRLYSLKKKNLDLSCMIKSGFFSLSTNHSGLWSRTWTTRKKIKLQFDSFISKFKIYNIMGSILFTRKPKCKYYLLIDHSCKWNLWPDFSTVSPCSDNYEFNIKHQELFLKCKY